MKIVNKTRLSLKLIKRVMKLANCKKDTKPVRIFHDKRLKRLAGYFNETPNEYIIALQNEGDILTLGHELRHLAQRQHVGFERFDYLNSNKTDFIEKDAEDFEVFLEVMGI